MSLSLTILKTVDDTVELFINNISKKFNIDIEELHSLWKNGDNNNKSILKNVEEKVQVENSETHDELRSDVIFTYNKAELVALCKKYGHKCSGVKMTLIKRLLGKDSSDNTQVKKPKKKNVKKEDPPVIQNIKQNIPKIIIRRNKFNNFEHLDTGLIYDDKQKLIIGKQNLDGSIDYLTEEDIDKCNAYKFKYKLPENLDKNTKLSDIKIDDLSEDEEDEKVEEVHEEDELLSDDEDEKVEEVHEEDELLSDDEIEEDELLSDEEYE